MIPYPGRAFVVGAACLALAASPAATGTATAEPLPPIGAEIPSSMIAIDSALEYNGQTYTLDFKGGINQRVDVNPEDPANSVRLRTIGFRVAAEVPDGGTVTLEQNDVDTDPQSNLRLTQKFPPSYEERDVISISAEIELPGQKPVTVQAKAPMILTAKLTRHPARGDRYRLEKPVDLVDPDQPNTVVARLTKFDSQRGGL
ncbi:hypothetical protein ACIA8C_42730 [Nocardia sp. NPDC051321]|uniref:hypothetical protein n=1 Tax=Nocardia sp. NPDC051321 TaxID=3364323 RepID=UPI00378D6D84